MRIVCPTSRRRLCGLLLVLATGWHLSTAGLFAAEGQDILEAMSGEVGRLVAELDHPDFATRNQAAARLEQLAGQPQLGAFLSSAFRRVLLSDETSFEVRSRLEPLVRMLPPPPGGEPQPDKSRIGPLLAQLGSDSYAERESAARQLKAMLSHVELIAPLWLELKRRTADPQLSASDRRALEPLLDQAREAWLLADPDKVPLPKPLAGEIARWIDDLSRLDEFVPADRHRRDLARRELLDLIARDDTRGQVLDMLGEKIAAADDTARGPLLELVDFAKAGMAAEVWSNHTLMTVQYLIIGLPQYNDTVTARKATHFDRIDEETAHCVSGNSLNPGDYPVGVAIPHPLPGQETMFYLTNLPTPRRRLAYEYHLKRDERLRLQEISERTLDYYLKRRTPLGEIEVLLLARLDQRSVSRFVGAYFDTVPNAPMLSTLNGITSQPTVHGAIAAVLSQIGTHEAVPALARLARSGGLGKRSYENRLDVAWVAALAIAGRDPWPGIDKWLADLLDERLPLTIDPDAPPELGACAAGLLLDRHGASTRPFGLHTAGESLTDSYRFIGYRFGSERDRQDVKRWWQKQAALSEAGRAAGLTESEPITVPSINLGAGERRPKVR
jgi:hypothetical protein